MTRLYLAANQGRMSGGEEMLLRAAEAARDLGLAVTVVAPEQPDETLRAAADAGFDVVAIPGGGRAGYARALRRWDRRRDGILWCHGLLPALATAARRRRLVHLHQLPVGLTQRVSLTLARRRAIAVLVPSDFMARRVPGSRALPNWTQDLSEVGAVTTATGSTVGFLGRLSQDKGLDVLAHALRDLSADRPGLRLLVAGDFRFVPDDQQEAVSGALAEITDQVDLQGWMSRESFFDGVGLAVFPSVWPEPFGLGVAESMAAGVPFVISDAGALPEVAGPEHPWTVRAGDSAALARVLDEALSADPVSVVARARLRWEAEYSPTAGRTRVAALLRELGLPVAENAS